VKQVEKVNEQPVRAKVVVENPVAPVIEK
jgi:hypothetical protein